MASRVPGVYLSSFTVNLYRSLEEVAFQPNPNLSVLIGPNGSGKTNILNAIQLLGVPGPSRYRETQPSPLAKRCSVFAEFLIRKKRLGYRAMFVLAPAERNTEEVVHTHESWNFRDFTGKNIWKEIPRLFFDPRYKNYILKTPGGKLIQHGNIEKSLDLSPATSRALKTVMEFKSSIKYYSASQFTNPSRSPSSFEIDEDNRVLETYNDRGPHLSFISGLYQTYKNDPDLYQSYLEIIGPNGIGLIKTIMWRPIVLSTGTVDVKTGGRVVRRKKKRVLIVPVVLLRRSRLSFNQLSEGTFRTLALLFYLITDKSGLLLVEEPEVCVHHGLLRSVIESIKAYSVRKQIIISTHSELVLDSVEPENVFSVTNQAAIGTTVRPLTRMMSSKGKAAMKDYLATSGSLGEYWTHGGIE